jgi:hypothetical protein
MSTPPLSYIPVEDLLCPLSYSLLVPPATQASEVESRFLGVSSSLVLKHTDRNTGIFYMAELCLRRAQAWIRNLYKIFDFSDFKLSPVKL